MTLTVEDGTGLVNAASYGMVSEADTYHADRGNTAWGSLSQTRKEQLLREGFDYMIQRFRYRWKGWRATSVQYGDWPRLGVEIDDVAAFPSAGHLSGLTYLVPSNQIPTQVKYAQFELALIAKDGALIGNLAQSKQSIQVGPIKIAYDPRSPQAVRCPVVSSLLIPYLESVGPMVKLAR